MFVLFWLLLPIVAFLYASVGHGGASGYIALMMLFGVADTSIRPTALLLNIGVSLLSFAQFWQSGHFRWRIFLLFSIASVPAAYVGGLIQLDAFWYKKILAVLLLFPVLKMWGIFDNRQTEGATKPVFIPLALLIGATIGLFSGMIGIGGGIILSPVLLLLGWATMKESAAVSALFIFVNSGAGMVGLYQKSLTISNEMIFMLVLALIGGSLGGYWGAKIIASEQLKKVLAVVLLIAVFKLGTS
jgi:uncharacterized protein